ncbi:PIN domain-containing protein [Almyronema epifaneia]|uniref:PIN domain-containing protein n=1 Tax=Almyronema epifaneia S1 TaxID=2991925 RepID=A0ABW6IFQ1_9CYAN
MAETPVYRLLFDTSALLAGSLRQWQQYGPLGECCLPEVVLEEMKFLCDRAPDPALEPKAREFLRFYPASGWQVSSVRQAHAALEPATGQSLSKRARQAIAVLECANGLAQTHRDQLIVLISNSQPLLKQLSKLQQVNLCGLPEPVLKNWSRTDQVPLPLLQGLARLQTEANKRPARPSQPAPSVSPLSPPRSPAVATRSRSPKRSSGRRGLVLGLALVAVAVVGLWFLKLSQPQRFEQIWQRFNLEG